LKELEITFEIDPEHISGCALFTLTGHWGVSWRKQLWKNIVVPHLPS